MIAKKVDLIVPVYNKSIYLNDLLYSFKELPDNYFNIIIVDDGSIDNSFFIVKSFIDNYKISNIYLYKKNNGGVSSARNFGLKYSTSEYVWFFDPDDQINLEFLLKFDEIKHLSDDILIFEYTLNFNKKNKRKKFCKYGLMEKKEYLLCNDALLTKSIDVNILWNKWYKRVILDEILFDESLSIGEDRCFNIDALSKDGCVRILNINIYSYYFYGTGTLSSDININKINDIYITNLKNMGIYGFGRNILKCHILNQSYLRISIFQKNILDFYLKEHEKFGIKILPFYSFKEFIVFIFIFFNFYKLFYFFRKK